MHTRISFFRAYTIIEMLMVILVVGILAAAAVPKFTSYFVARLEGARKKVIYDIRYVQQYAVARHTNTRIVFDTGNDSYLAQQESSPGSADWTSVPLTSPFFRNSNLQANFKTDYQYQGIDITSASFGGSATLQFDLNGTPVSGGTVVLSFKGESRTVTVEANTGFTR